APHALHMPSHIFTRLGYWDESIATNRRSAAAEPDSNAAVHPNDYMVYAYLQQGRDADAHRVIERSKVAADRFYGAILGYNAVAMQARYPLERSEWAEAAALPVPAGSAPFVEAIARFARAVGSARSGNAAQAKVEVAALTTLRDSLAARKDSYWATIVDAQRLAASAWVARSEGRSEDAVRLARQGAELEETVEKHPVTPGPLLPARELEGDLLLELGRAADALRSYEKTLEREPRRARALYGAARAAEQSKNTAAARAHYQELAQLMKGADASRAEPKAAREFLARGL
ncbi:MAG TPA: tetratricopeptide repeat protein, partial [Gemmatimonadaceae bacterium]|nr:tetratricopeptide repeat protein [Gemmatimonadaceae bacterium]